MLVIASDTSNSIVVVLVAERREFVKVHDILCRKAFGTSKCYLHMKELPSRTRRELSRFIASNAKNLLRSFELVLFIVVKGKFKDKAKDIIKVFRDLMRKFTGAMVILASDLPKIIKSFEKKLCVKAQIDDKAIEVQVSDAVVYSYRRHRARAFLEVARFIVL